MDEVKGTEIAFAGVLRIDTSRIDIEHLILNKRSYLPANGGAGRLVVPVDDYALAQPLVIDLVVPSAHM